MGLDYNGVRLISYIHYKKFCMKSTGMLGRQFLHTDQKGISRIFDEFGISYNEADVAKIIIDGAPYSESLLRYMGASEVVSFDNSDYEGAAFIHNFNESIDLQFHKKFDLLCK